MQAEDVLKSLKSVDPARVVVFVGSGFTVDLQFPTWPRLLELLQSEVAHHDSELAALMGRRIAKGDLLGAAQLAYEDEVPPNVRARFFDDQFSRSPNLGRRHRVLGALPVFAFATTNYDNTIERAVRHGDKRQARLFNGPGRFQAFNSCRGLHMESFNAKFEEEALVLKIHDDFVYPESMVLPKRSFDTLADLPGFQAFYQTLFREHHVLCIGFSAEDPNLLKVLLEEITNYASYGAPESFLVLPSGSRPPDALDGTSLRAAYYDPASEHAELTELLENLNKAWRATLHRPIGDEPPLALDAPDPTADRFAPIGGPSIYELMTIAVERDVDTKIVDCVARAMVRQARADAHPHVHDRSVANQLMQKYRISRSQAQSLVRRFADAGVPEPAAETLGPEPLETLAQGVRARCLAYDSTVSISAAVYRTIVRDVIETGLQTTGNSLALALLQADPPEASELSSVVRDRLTRTRWQGVGDPEREALLLAIPDLFRQPNAEESSVLTRLALTGAAFGLIQAIPDLSLVDQLLPTELFVDANVILPLIAMAGPRASEIARLIALARQLRIRVRVLPGFVEEAVHHLRVARETVRAERLTTAHDVRGFVSGQLSEFVNVFLLAAARDDLSEDTRTIDYLATTFGELDGTTVSRLLGASGIERLGKEEVPIVHQDPLATLIVTSKRYHSGYSAHARVQLAKHEASQMVVVQRRQERGQTVWFVTEDAQLRRILRRSATPGAECVVSTSGALALFETLTVGHELSPAFPRFLWSPTRDDLVDDVLGDAIRGLLPELQPGQHLPVAEARKAAIAALEARARGEDQSPDDASTIATPKAHVVARDSVYRVLGAQIDAERHGGS